MYPPRDWTATESYRYQGGYRFTQLANMQICYSTYLNNLITIIISFFMSSQAIHGSQNPRRSSTKSSWADLGWTLRACPSPGSCRKPRASGPTESRRTHLPKPRGRGHCSAPKWIEWSNPPRTQWDTPLCSSFWNRCECEKSAFAGCTPGKRKGKKVKRLPKIL